MQTFPEFQRAYWQRRGAAHRYRAQATAAKARGHYTAAAALHRKAERAYARAEALYAARFR